MIKMTLFKILIRLTYKFSRLNKSIDPSIFEESDNFSHLTTEAYKNYYYPSILKEIKF